MTRMLSAGTALALLVTTVPAFADLSARDVWRDWQEISEQQGLALTNTGESFDGETLIVEGVSSKISQTDVEGTFTLGDIRFQERSDGSVAITMGNEFPMDLNLEVEPGENLQMEMVFTQSGLTIIASEDGTSTRYDYSAPTMGFRIDEIVVEGAALSQAEVDFDIRGELSDAVGSSVFDNGAPRRMISEFRAGGAAMQANFSEEGSGEGANISISVEDLASFSEGSISSMGSFEALAPLVEAGLSTEGGYTYGKTNYSATVLSQDGTMNIAGGLDEGAVDVSIDKSGLVYATRNLGHALSVSGSTIPLPSVNFSIAETGFTFQMPIVPSEEPSDFGFAARMLGLEIDEMLWAMLDPTEQLPRDGANIEIALTGKANWFVDITDPAVQNDFEGDMTDLGELSELALNMRLSFIGAEATAGGQFTFDYDDMETFDGMPRPEGSAELELKGVNGVLDTLVNMGLLPADQAMGARMMMGIFARPGPGEDTLNSTIEVTPDGTVEANGQRIR